MKTEIITQGHPTRGINDEMFDRLNGPKTKHPVTSVAIFYPNGDRVEMTRTQTVITIKNANNLNA